MTSRSVRQTDVLVVGAGPAGAAAARLLAAWGHDVVVIDKPGGEAARLAESIPPSADKILRAIGAIDAVRAAGWDEDPEVVAYAIFGQRVDGGAMLRDGDRVELLRPLLADPKDARRQRVEERRRLPGKRGA